MRLRRLRRDWERLAESDPLWAVLTDPAKSGGKWDPSEFFATGIAEVAADMKSIGSLAPDLDCGRALDFGCGAGRLTQALALHFRGVTGVDISGRMLALARKQCPDPRVTFVQNTAPDLRTFGDGTFDLVYSRITLQHVAPRYALRYLAEFVRVLAPGGVLLVQVPERVPAGDPPDRLHFSLWPPTLWMRVVRNVRYHHPGWFSNRPKMQMHAVSRPEVEAAITAAGARILAVESMEHGEVANLVYIGRRPH